MLFLTAAELKDLGDELTELLMSKFRDRRTDPSRRPAGSLPVELLVMSYPISLPGDQHLPDTSPAANPDANQKGNPS